MSTSSIYSSVLSIGTDSSVEEIERKPAHFSYKNPYANSLWVETRGEAGNKTIKGINNKSLPMRTEFHSFVFPKRTEHKEEAPERTTSAEPQSDEVPVCLFRGISLDPVEHLIRGEERLLDQLNAVQTYRKFLRTKYLHIITSKQEYLIFGNIDTLIDLTILVLKLLPKGIDSLFVHLQKLHLVSYPDPKELERCMTNDVWKWLDECEFHTGIRLSQALTSPRLRLMEYKSTLDKMLLSCDEYEQIEKLYDSKTSVEKLIDSLAIEETPIAPFIDGMSVCDALMTDFKKHYHGLLRLKSIFEDMGEPILKFIQHQKQLTLKWQRLMAYEDDMEECYIKSIYHCYYTKLCEQELSTHIMLKKMSARVLKAISLALESCDCVRVLIRRFKHSQSPKLRNELVDELPMMIGILMQLKNYISICYMKYIEQWYGLLCGDKKSDSTGDNFDIVEMFVHSRYNTRQAMKEFAVIPTSRIVRKLFGM